MRRIECDRRIFCSSQDTSVVRKQKECSGKRCKAVIVRSSDRHFISRYQSAAGDWKKYWTRQHQLRRRLPQ
ncbi:MAG: hypothetical protein HC879_12740 [Leptolyngbyaceae cyanobacterium SL_5_9]|nr:hypothetical protein [Leptolyngbyaceae cyanobacterium SL_5_9]NJO75007.1 hypothetical protein [Leptolyngbyaceae cyanobacterium RM1_406_9]